MKRLLLLLSLFIGSLQAMQPEDIAKSADAESASILSKAEGADREQTQLQQSELLATFAKLKTLLNLDDKTTLHDLLNPIQSERRPPLVDAQLKLVPDKNLINTQDALGKTHLIREIENYCKPEIIEVLLANGADICMQDKSGRTVLHALLDFMAAKQEDRYNYGGRTSTYTLATPHEKYTKTLDLLLKHRDAKKLITIEDKNSRTPLIYAASLNCLPSIVKTLLNAGSPVRGLTKDNKTILHHLIKAHYDRTTKRELLNIIIAKDQKERNAGQTPLIDFELPVMHAIRTMSRSNKPENFDNIRFLYDLFAQNPNIRLTDKWGTTYLHALSRQGNPYISEHDRGYITWDAKQWKKVKKNIATLIFKRTGNELINKQDDYGNTPLHECTVPQRIPSRDRWSWDDIAADPTSSIPLIKQLFQHGANGRIKNNAGQNFINRAFEANFYTTAASDIIAEIPEEQRDAVLNGKDNNGKTALMKAIDKYYWRNEYSAYHGRTMSFPISACAPLLAWGANPNIKDHERKTALEQALIANNELAVNELWKYSPRNRWQLYRKYHPVLFYSGLTAAGLAGYASWKLASASLPYIKDALK